MKILRFVHTHFLWLMPLVVFVSAVLPKLSYSTLSSEFDPYYHHAHSLTYTSGEPFMYPVFSLVNLYQTDLWFLYHLVLGQFMWLLSLLSVDAILANKIFHAFLGALVFMMIFIVARSLARALGTWQQTLLPSVPYATPLSAQTIGIFAVAFLMLAPLHSTSFLYRVLSNERPHIFIIILTLAIVPILLHRRYWWLAIIGAIAALSYSFSFIILMPIVVLIGVWIVIRRQSDMKWYVPTIAFGVAMIGLGIGVLLHPTSYGYLVAGLGQTSYAVLSSLFSWTGLFGTSNVLPPGEMRFLPSEISFSFGILVSVLLMIGYLGILFHRRAAVRYSHEAVVFIAVLVIGLLFTMLQVAIPRAVEYGFPFLSCALAILVGQLLWPIVKGYSTVLREREGEFGDTYRSMSRAVADLSSDARLRKGMVALLIAVVFFAPLANSLVMTVEREIFNDIEYQGATQYLSTAPDHLLLIEYFHDYPTLIYTNPAVRVSVGFDSRFLHLYNPDLGNDITNFWGHTAACQLKTCAQPPGIITERMKTSGITHILVDTKSVAEAALITYLEGSDDVRMVYRDDKYTNIILYEILF